MENSTNVSPSVVNLFGDNSNEVKGIKENENEKVEEPKVNLKFDSIEEAKDYYIRYASYMGFEITRRTSKRNLDDEVNFVAFVCKRYGSSVSTSQNPLKPQPVGKTNCEAKMNIVLCKNNEWRVSHYIPHHNHPLASPSQIRYFPCNRVIKPHVKRKLEINDKAGIRMNKSYNSLMVEAGGYENLTFLEKDCRNYVEEVRRLELGEGDAIAVQNYFMKMQARNSNFFYSMDMDDDGRLQNIFWADGRSREAYKEFGDVVTFDTTYLTNTYGMPFAPFVGVNHHGQSILLGCGLISGETTMMFVWLFKTWLACMSDCPPQAIITDQDRAMRNAIEIVFPNARHRWCLWHIMKKLPEKLSGYTDYKLIKISLKSVVYDSLSPTEFEVNWTQMIKKYGLHKNVWLGELYDDRHRWVPAFVKDCFWAGMSTTQRNEGMNSFFDKYIHPKTTLKQFVDQYENAWKDKAEKESLANFNSFNSRLPCVTHYKMEEQFQKVYTIAKFKEFQLELTGKMYCEISSFKENATIANYEVYEDVKVGEGSKRVIFQVFLNKLYSNEEHEVNCNCRLFEFRGILCRHAILVLIHKKIFKVPNKYIIPRWRKDIKRQYTRVITSYDDWTIKPEGKIFDKMCNAIHGIADLAIDSEKKCNMVVD